MKKLKTILSALVMGVVAISLTGCQNEEEMTYAYGKGISFNCVSESHGTRAAYSGDVTAAGIERINWEENDLIRICCPQASKPTPKKFSDYVVSGVTENVSVSEAKITHKVAADSLCWGDKGPHDFYAVYPSPATSGTWVSVIEGKKVTGTVKATQNGDGRFSDGMVMVANTTVADPSTFDKSAVFLDFKPITTAITFTIQNGQTSDMTVEYVQLVSKSHPISGEFVWNIGDDPVHVAAKNEDEKKVKIAFSPTVTLQANKGNNHTFTFFLRPDYDLNDLSLVVTTSGTTYTSKLQTESGAFTFESGKKYVINGVVLEKWFTIQSISCWDDDKLREEPIVEEEILF